jgi:hypothetical protein
MLGNGEKKDRQSITLQLWQTWSLCVTDGDVVPLHLVWFFEMTFGGVAWVDWHFRKKWCLPKTFLAPTHGPVISKLLYWVITGFPTCVRQKKDRPPNSNAEHSFLKMQNAKPRNWQLAEHFRSHTSLEPLNGWKWMRYTLNILYGWFSDIECIGTHFIFNDIALFAVVS